MRIHSSACQEDFVLYLLFARTGGDFDAIVDGGRMLEGRRLTSISRRSPTPGATLSGDQPNNRLFFTMLSSNMMPMMLPRPSPVFQQSPFPLGMYHPSIMFQPSQLLPTMVSSLPARGALPTHWKSSLGYPTSSPPLKSSLMSTPSFRAYSSGSPSPTGKTTTTKGTGSSSGRSRSPSPPCSPDSASSNAGEKTAFTIDAILSSNKRSPSSTSGASSRSGYGSDRGLTPSPDSFQFASPNSTSPSKIWNASRFQETDYRCGVDGNKDIGEYHFDPRCDSKLSSTSVSATKLGSQENQFARNTSINTDKSLKRLRCDDGEWNPRSKRVRTIFTQDQLERLEQEFDRQQYMVGSERLYLAAELNLSESQVKVWFQNRRIKWRKQNFEKQQVQLAHIRAVQESNQHKDGDHSSDEDNELANDLASPLSADETRIRVESNDVQNINSTTTTRPQPPTVNGAEDDFEQRILNAAPSSVSVTSSTTASFSATLQQEVKRVEERLAMRLCRRNMVQSSTSTPSSSSSSLTNSSHLRLMSSIRRMDSSRDVEYRSTASRE